MPAYAIKLGEVILQSDKPITAEQREHALRTLQNHEGFLVLPLAEGVAAVLRLDSH